MSPRPVRTVHIPQEVADKLVWTIMRGTEERPDGCWIRTKAVNPVTGYTSISTIIDGRRRYLLAHRVVYVVHKGEIPPGLVVDHKCNQPACCNPKHLRAVTQQRNILRSKSQPCAINARKTRCPKGHEYSTYASGKRYCRTCRNARATLRYRANVAA